MELEVKSWSLGLLWHNFNVLESGKGTAGLATETVQMMYVQQCIKLFRANRWPFMAKVDNEAVTSKSVEFVQICFRHIEPGQERQLCN